MFTYEINVICNTGLCPEREATSPMVTPDIEAALNMVQEKGWQVDVINGHIRTLCPDCADCARERVAARSGRVLKRRLKK